MHPCLLRILRCHLSMRQRDIDIGAAANPQVQVVIGRSKVDREGNRTRRAEDQIELELPLPWHPPPLDAGRLNTQPASRKIQGIQRCHQFVRSGGGIAIKVSDDWIAKPREKKTAEVEDLAEIRTYEREGGGQLAVVIQGISPITKGCEPINEGLLRTWEKIRIDVGA